MSTLTPPASLKHLNTFILRSKELRNADPIISYYCMYHAAQLALAHPNRDAEVTEFIGKLLDEVEQIKTTSPKLQSEEGKAIIADDEVSQAYIEGFALKVFAKADKDVYDKTTTKATIQAFMAAASFYDLLKIFQNPLESDIAEKIKYAKFQAARIAKAYKSGEDPNDYEPPVPKDPDEDLLTQELLDKANEEVEEQKAFETKSPSLKAYSPPPRPQEFSPSLSESYASPTTFAQPVATPPPFVQPEVHHKRLSKKEIQELMDDSELITTVQKHAKYAISALNYEDKQTAIKELTTALDLLKAHQDDESKEE